MLTFHMFLAIVYESSKSSLVHFMLMELLLHGAESLPVQQFMYIGKKCNNGAFNYKGFCVELEYFFDEICKKYSNKIYNFFEEYGYNYRDGIAEYYGGVLKSDSFKGKSNFFNILDVGVRLINKINEIKDSNHDKISYFSIKSLPKVPFICINTTAFKAMLKGIMDKKAEKLVIIPALINKKNGNFVTSFAECCWAAFILNGEAITYINFPRCNLHENILQLVTENGFTLSDDGDFDESDDPELLFNELKVKCDAELSKNTIGRLKQLEYVSKKKDTHSNDLKQNIIINEEQNRFLDEVTELHLRDILNDGEGRTWGGSIELGALSQIYDVEIVIH